MTRMTNTLMSIDKDEMYVGYKMNTPRKMYHKNKPKLTREMAVRVL